MELVGRVYVVFSKTYCPFCKMAKDALRQAGLSEKDYVLYELDERGERERERQAFSHVGGATKRSVSTSQRN